MAPVPSKDVLSVQTEAFLSELPPEAEPAIQDFSADISAGQEKNEIFEDMNADNSRVSSENPQALNEIAPASSEIAGNDSRNIPPTAIPGSSAMPSEETSSKGIPFFMRVILGTILVCMGAFITIYLLKMRRKKISEERMLRFQRRQQRLLDIGMSNDEFNLLLKQKRMRRKK